MPNKYEKYFKILDLDIGASKEDLKKAFRKLSHIWHPDNHMGKSLNVQNRASEKFKEISSAYQILKDYLRAEERKKAEQDRRDREEKERKQREEKERKQREEESRRKAEQDRKDRGEKEHKYWEEQAKKKHEEEKNKKKNTDQDSGSRWGRGFLVCSAFLVVFFVGLNLSSLIVEWGIDVLRKEYPHQESLSWKRSFRGEIIGRQGLTLNLQRNGDKFTGDYIDIHEMMKKDLIGTFDNKSPQYLVLERYIDEKKTESFYGNFLAGKEVEGEYISQSEPNNKLKFKLKEIDRQNEAVVF